MLLFEIQLLKPLNIKLHKLCGLLIS